jgi:hypothetical protein
MDTEQGRSETLLALMANPYMGLAVSQLMGHNQVRINTFLSGGTSKAAQA